MDLPRNLTPKQRLFVAEYLKDLNATQAAIRAGYSPRTANEQAARLLAKVSIRAATEQAFNKRAAKVELSADYVLGNLTEITERCMQHAAVLDKEGEPTGEYRFDASGANRALELLGKHLGMFVEVTRDISEPTSIEINITETPKPS